MSKEVRRVLFAAAGALALALGLGLGGCKDAWRILTTGDLYWENDKKEYAFRYDSSGGELYDGTPEGDIAEGTTVTLPSSGGREGYTLAGFTLSGAAEGDFNPGDTFTMPAGEVTAAANWTEVRNFINLGNPQASTGAGWSYNEASGVFTISGGAEVEVRGSTARNRVVVRGTATVRLSDANIALSSGDASPLDLASGANVTLILSGANTLTAAGGGAGIHAPEGTTLTITSAEGDGQTGGRLYAAGGMKETGDFQMPGAAGIGGGTGGESAGHIIIRGGNITAAGGSRESRGGGAGIGGGGYVGWGKLPGGSGGRVEISGGVVTATGGYFAAGIGGALGQAPENPEDWVSYAWGGSGGEITITGGEVNAKGHAGGAGIGGSWFGGGGTVRITGGTGTAEGVRDGGWELGAGVGHGDAAVVHGTPTGSFNGGEFPSANPYTWR
ncbi:MAG: S-layer homology domain-containing protein [Treponematales bacterium]